jgi:hypothetical protein
VSCKKAIGVANDMAEKFKGRLDVKIYTLDAKEAKPYVLEFKGSTNVLFEKECVPLAISIDKDKMEAFLSQRL